MTKREKFAMLAKIPEVQSNEILREFIAHEVELLDKKNSTPKKPTAQQIVNAGILEAIIERMEPDRCYTITEIIKEIPECAELTNQRVSAIIRPALGKRIERIEDKRKTYFKVVEG